MFLRQIQIRGFKSFADKTVLEFIPGVSVIVGPNGSGQVEPGRCDQLGARRAGPSRPPRRADGRRHLRRDAQPVPRSGWPRSSSSSTTRRARSPCPMSEIEVSRTIFRSGESEYRINGKLVRLLDVQELLSEIGDRPGAPYGRRPGPARGGAPRPARGAPEVHRGGGRHREASPPQGAGGAQARGPRPGSAPAAGRDGRAPATAEAAPAAGRDGQEARDARPSRRRSSRGSSPPRGCGRCSRSAIAGEAAGTRAGPSARRPAPGWTGWTREVLAGRTRAPPPRGDSRSASSGSAPPRPTDPRPSRRSGARSIARAERGRSSPPRPAARLGSTRSTAELARVEAELERTVAELAERERELDDAERAFRDAEQHRREVDEIRRRAGEEAAGRRVRDRGAASARSPPANASATGSKRSVRDVGERSAGLRTEQEEIEADIERARRSDVAARGTSDPARGGAAPG